MIVRSGHINFGKNVKYKNLAKIFPDIMKKFLEESHQTSEEPELIQLLIKRNVHDLERNKKPEGYNREGKMRLMFPIVEAGVKMYIYRPTKSEDVAMVTEAISKFLRGKKISHKVTWDDMVYFKLKGKKAEG